MVEIQGDFHGLPHAPDDESLLSFTKYMMIALLVLANNAYCRGANDDAESRWLPAIQAMRTASSLDSESIHISTQMRTPN